MSAKKKLYGLLSLVFVLIAFVTAFNGIHYTYADTNTVYLGGIPAGFTLCTRGAKIVGLCDVATKDGAISPSKIAEINVGDVILSIDGVEVNSALEVGNCLNDCEEKLLLLERYGEKLLVDITPVLDLNNNYKIGVYIRDDVSGIGTLTFIKDGRFASLGHPVINDCGGVLDIVGGKLYGCCVTGAVKGERGKPGELRGIFLKEKEIAVIDKNLCCGVYGEIGEDFCLDSFRKAEVGTAKMGSAKVLTTVDGINAEEYDISIVKTENGTKDQKNFVIKITDKKLLDLTGGIVQGMSGSPILQDGKIVGAVTHVFINDSTRGFGISIDNMLNN